MKLDTVTVTRLDKGYLVTTLTSHDSKDDSSQSEATRGYSDFGDLCKDFGKWVLFGEWPV